MFFVCTLEEFASFEVSKRANDEAKDISDSQT